MDADALVHEYLGRIESGAADLAPERRAELVADLRDHIALALAEEDPLDEAAVQRVLGRLGSPDEIVAAETEQPSDRPTRAESRLATWWHGLSVEARAMRFLTIGAVVLPFVGPLIGLWFVSGSARWALPQKRTAGLIVFVLLALPAILVLPMVAAGELTWVITTGGFSLPLVPLAGFVAAGYLVLATAPVLASSRRK